MSMLSIPLQRKLEFTECSDLYFMGLEPVFSWQPLDVLSRGFVRVRRESSIFGNGFDLSIALFRVVTTFFINFRDLIQVGNFGGRF